MPDETRYQTLTEIAFDALDDSRITMYTTIWHRAQMVIDALMPHLRRELANADSSGYRRGRNEALLEAMGLAERRGAHATARHIQQRYESYNAPIGPSANGDAQGVDDGSSSPAVVAQSASYDHARCGPSGGCAAPVADFDPVNCPAENAPLRHDGETS